LFAKYTTPLRLNPLGEDSQTSTILSGPEQDVLFLHV